MTIPHKLNVPVARPQLPPAEAILPYLREIDAARYYSNYGPLVRRLQDRLAARIGFTNGSEGYAVTCANATLGLTLALLAQGAASGARCIMPAWAFVASPLAASMAGLVPCFADVEEASWAMTPEIAERAIAASAAPVGAVLAVAPFGAPIDIGAWDDFRRRTGLAVAIDAAAGFDGLRAGQTPSVVSLHATKALGIGEGGFVATGDRELVIDIARRCNFGFFQVRETESAATNAKMSEYHAAVGLAALDRWPETRAAFLRVAGAYRRHLAGAPVSFLRGFGESWASSTCVIRVSGLPAEALAERLAAAGIETRAWWGQGCHRQPHFAESERLDLPVTDLLAASTLGLPCFRDMAEETIAAVSAEVRKALGGG